ncbi:hypothetical protein WR25_12460 [Diploscapter pachys]|uniref:mannose-6-phosphate isomerase n=1 Tax=Diploscapter pachys TaxID=2018661 RepID=A0A2A2KUC8_9BILA|nr:hypothetical protein WR25_12460 [Diploscapter pachys]
MLNLTCKIQNYDWGKIGLESEVAKLIDVGGHANVDQQAKYAELWMGVHPNGPSFTSEGQSLADVIKSQPAYLGQHEMGTLQFLFKVLSVRKALSVQSHPTKAQAKVLHANDPKNYPDDNHKPEMAIALTEFQLLSTPELLDFVERTEEGKKALAALCETSGAEQKSALQTIFSSIWKQPESEIVEAVRKCGERIGTKSEKSDLDNLMIRLQNEYPGDVGVFAPLLLNYFTLQPGEATFLGPNQPHAYLFGDCIECMACSDNTIRAGLTPKFKDIETLANSLEFTMSGPPYFVSKEVGKGVRLYDPPVPEFAVQRIDNNAEKLSDENASSILIVVGGQATIGGSNPNKGCCLLEAKRGAVIFLPADLTGFSLQNASSDFLAFRAYTPKTN